MTSLEEQASRYDDLFLLDEETRKRIYGVLSDLLRLVVVMVVELGPPPRRLRVPPDLKGLPRRKTHSITVSLEELARRFYMDRYQLSRCFTRQVGCPPHRYLMYKRLQRAALLIEEDHPVSQVPALCGFVDYSNFYGREAR